MDPDLHFLDAGLRPEPGFCSMAFLLPGRSAPLSNPCAPLGTTCRQNNKHKKSIKLTLKMIKFNRKSIFESLQNKFLLYKFTTYLTCEYSKISPFITINTLWTYSFLITSFVVCHVFLPWSSHLRHALCDVIKHFVIRVCQT